MPDIIIEIQPDGTTTKTVQGIAGESCMIDPLSMGLDAVLGKKTKTAHTTDYYETASQGTHVSTKR